MGTRLELQTLLEWVIGSRAVYFQPPPGVSMTYPCIVYKRDYGKTQFADNKPYQIQKRYQITVIDKRPDSPIIDKIAALPSCIFDRNFIVDNLNHDVFTLFY